VKVKLLKAGEYQDWDAHTDHGKCKRGDVLECGEHYAEWLVEAKLAEFVGQPEDK